MTERQIQFVDDEGNIYTAFFGKTVPLWNIRVNDQGGHVVFPAHDADESYNRLEFFNYEDELMQFIAQFPLTRKKD